MHDIGVDSALPKQIGHYQIICLLGQGGMGEVFLALDPTSGRHVALKRIRKKMQSNRAVQEQFLKEAKIASQLNHPSILPIYTINQEGSEIFYTMPYIEGETLKQILHTTYQETKEGEVTHPIGSSIPSLMRIYLNVCQAIAYSHSKHVIHRDIKPDNIIVGKYGEVLILDWGLAKYINEQPRKKSTNHEKVPGTLAYLAPERLSGDPSSVLTDIYSLGVILHQILTLHLPFQRFSITHFRKTVHLEQLSNPQEIAPYRDIPQHLADIARRALQANPNLRFQIIEDMIVEIQSYIEGRPEWIPATQLHWDRKEGWEFQENILLAKHLAITRLPSVMEWVSLMISSASFYGNTKIKTEVCLKNEGQGIGFLLNIPEAHERKGLEEGYCLWIGSPLKPGCKLFRSNIEVMNIPNIYFKTDTWHQVQIEKIDNHLRFYLDGTLQFHHISHIPLSGTHVGILFRDADFEMAPLEVYIGSQNVMVNCLSIPDAFLATKNYQKALSEYRRIGYSFVGRAEGREALFRAGITLLEEAISTSKKQKKQMLYDLSLDEFYKLRSTPGAPLEYLGKALVYQALDEINEEIKCLELALRKYPKHPLLNILSEHIIFRLHESSLSNRSAAYQFAILSLLHLPHIFKSEENHHLLTSLTQHLEPLPFIIPPDDSLMHIQLLHLAVQLSFWLVKPITLIEIIETTQDTQICANALYCLLYLGHIQLVSENLYHLQDPIEMKLIHSLLHSHEQQSIPPTISSPSLLRYATYLLQNIPSLKEAEQIYTNYLPLCPTDHLYFDVAMIKIYLLNNKWQNAQQLLEKYPPEFLIDEKNPLYSLMGCWLWHQEGKEIALSHFSGMGETPFPPTTGLLSAFLRKTIDLKKGWITQAFFWEKAELFQQLDLFYHCAKKKKTD